MSIGDQSDELRPVGQSVPRIITHNRNNDNNNTLGEPSTTPKPSELAELAREEDAGLDE